MKITRWWRTGNNACGEWEHDDEGRKEDYAKCRNRENSRSKNPEHGKKEIYRGTKDTEIEGNAERWKLQNEESGNDVEIQKRQRCTRLNYSEWWQIEG